jgi:hypothetical protein
MYTVMPDYQVKSSDAECFSYKGQGFCASKDNAEAAELVRQLNALLENKAAANIPVETAHRFYDEISQWVPEKGHALEVDATFYKNMATKIEKMKNEDPASKLVKDYSLLLNIFVEEGLIYRRGADKQIEAVNHRDLFQTEIDQEFARLRKIPLVDWAKRLGKSSYSGLDREMLQKRIDDFRAKGESYQADAVERDAQIDLLFRALLPSYNYAD